MLKYINWLSIAVWQKAMNAWGGIVGVIGRVLFLQRGVRRFCITRQMSLMLELVPFVYDTNLGVSWFGQCRANSQVKRGVKLAFLEYAFAA